MGHLRYQRPKAVDPEREELPTNTICTILTRQSTVMQAERNTFSAEVNPQDLYAVARRFGFDDAHIRLVDLDMGIGAYSTTIGDRPGLHTWLYEDLPSGRSTVVLVSNEDRLFRDRYETEHNQFIAQCATYGGWAICGTTVYNFRRPFDQDRFRWACKAGKEFIERHLKARLHPSLQRAAMSGRYPGGNIPWGYLVDYDQRHQTYKHFVRYEPHATFVVEQVFRRFVAQPHPSIVELARAWRREGLVWPFFGPEVDPRTLIWFNAHFTRDEDLGGYVMRFRQAQTILTDVVYLGWRVRAGEIALDPSGGPAICHEPLVDQDLFRWCYDRLIPKRPEWAPMKPELAQPVMAAYKPRRSRKRSPEDIKFIAAGKVRCAMHTTRFSPTTSRYGRAQLECIGAKVQGVTGEVHYGCPAVPVPLVEAAISEAFVEQLVLDERDVQALARVAQERITQQVGEATRIQRQIEEQQRIYTRAKQLAYSAPELEGDLLADMREAKRTIATLQARLEDFKASEAPSSPALRLAEQAVGLVERIRATFPEWPRPAQARVLALALADGVLGRVDRHHWGLWLKWQGGDESRRAIFSRYGLRVGWTQEEHDLLRTWYTVLTEDALLAMFPGRTWRAIKKVGLRLGLSRDQLDPSRLLGIVPTVLPARAVDNTMASYGFIPLFAAGSSGGDTILARNVGRGGGGRGWW